MKAKCIIVIALGMLLSSCSQYTCPTYAKVESIKTAKVVRL